jgi:hypothetical protein
MKPIFSLFSIFDAPWHWWKPTVVGASALILMGAGYMSWRHFPVTARAPSEKIMLAVLPFENLTGDPNKEYLADGLTEETISQLGRLNPEQLGVIARTSVMGYKHKDERLDQIGRDLLCNMCWKTASAKAEIRFALQLSSFR